MIGSSREGAQLSTFWAVHGFGRRAKYTQGCLYVVHTACPKARHHHTDKPLQSAPQHSLSLLSFFFLLERVRDHLQMSLGP